MADAWRMLWALGFIPQGANRQISNQQSSILTVGELHSRRGNAKQSYKPSKLNFLDLLSFVTQLFRYIFSFMPTVHATPNATILTDRSAQSQPWSHGAVRSRGTFRSIASNDVAATAAMTEGQLTLFWCSLAAHSTHEVVSYPRGTSCTDGGLDRVSTEASDAPRTGWRGSSDECEPPKAGFRGTAILRGANEGWSTFSSLLLVRGFFQFETEI